MSKCTICREEVEGKGICQDCLKKSLNIGAKILRKRFEKRGR